MNHIETTKSTERLELRGLKENRSVRGYKRFVRKIKRGAGGQKDFEYLNVSLDLHMLKVYNTSGICWRGG